MKIFGVLALALALPLAAGGCSASETAKSGLQIIPLSIQTKAGPVRRFRVEVARTPEEQERGLMFRESLPADGGMIFPFKAPRIASFWMHNTLIPLDMIFIRQDGTIARIAPETVPYSLDPVSSGEPVTAVLELAGGKAAALGIAEDDKVDWED